MEYAALLGVIPSGVFVGPHLACAPCPRFRMGLALVGVPSEILVGPWLDRVPPNVANHQLRCAREVRPYIRTRRAAACRRAVRAIVGPWLVYAPQNIADSSNAVRTRAMIVRLDLFTSCPLQKHTLFVRHKLWASVSHSTVSLASVRTTPCLDGCPKWERPIIQHET